MSNRLKTKLYILADKIHRKNDRGSFYISIAYVQEEKSVKHVSFPLVKHLESTLEKGKYYLCTNVGTIGDTVRLTDSSKVANTGTSSEQQRSKRNVLSELALNKPAKQSTTHYSHSANFAVDGNKGTDFFVDKCSCTNESDLYPWWSVDLKAVYNITSVRIFNRGMDSAGIDVAARLRYVTVKVGLTESDVNTPCGVFAGPGTLSQLVVIDCPTSPQGRFLKISAETEYLTLCEVEVFGF